MTSIKAVLSVGPGSSVHLNRRQGWEHTFESFNDQRSGPLPTPFRKGGNNALDGTLLRIQTI